MNLLIQTSTLQVISTLAMQLALNEAIILQLNYEKLEVLTMQDDSSAMAELAAGEM